MKQENQFFSNCNKTVLLPKLVASADEVIGVDVAFIGRTSNLTSEGEVWSIWFNEPGLSRDFDRDQSVALEREEI